jgi:hypothetical protein
MDEWEVHMPSHREEIERQVRERQRYEELIRVDTRLPFIDQFRALQPHISFPLAVPTDVAGLDGVVTSPGGPLNAPIIVAILGKRGVQPMRIGVQFCQTVGFPARPRGLRPFPAAVMQDVTVRGEEAWLYHYEGHGEIKSLIRLVWRDDTRHYWLDSGGLPLETILRIADSVRLLDQIEAS